MSTGFVLNIPQEMLNRLEDADKKIEKLAKTSEDAQTRIVSAFKSIGTHGLDAFITKINEVQSKLSQLGNTQINIGANTGAFTGLTSQAQNVIDEVNRIVTAMGKVKKAAGDTGMAKNPFAGMTESLKDWNNLQSKIDEADQKIKKLTSTTMDYERQMERIRSGQQIPVAISYNEYAYAKDKIAALQEEKKIYQEKQAEITKQNNALADQVKLQNSLKQFVDKQNSLPEQKKRREYEAMRQMYIEDEKASEAAEKKKLKDAEDAEKKRQKLREQRVKEEEKAAERARKAYERQYKPLPSTITTKQAEQLVAQSMGATSISQRQVAIKNLQTAINNLDSTDKRYDQTVRKLNAEIRRQKDELNKLGVESNKVRDSHRGLLDISGQLARKLALVFSVSQITGYVKKLIEVRGEFELQQRSLQAILQNKDEANRIWQQTVDLAVRSPFRVKELVSYTKQLAAYRIESDKLFETNKMLADISAGLGVDMQRLILAFGQVRSAAYLRGTELRQFTEAGIPILEQLAQYFTELEGRAVSVGDVFERVSKRMVSFADVEEIFKRMTAEGGTFYRMQEIQAETLKGMWSNLKDSIDIMVNDIGKGNESTLKSSLALVKQLVDNWRLVKAVIETAGISLMAYFGVDVLRKIGRGIKALYATISAHPLLAIVSVLGLIATAIWRVREAQNALTAAMSEVDNEVLGSLEEGIGLYRKLAEAVNDATKSSEERNKALDNLKSRFQDILPDQYLELEYIKQIGGNYKDAEKAMTDYYDAKAKAQKKDRIEGLYAKELDTDTSELISATRDVVNKLGEKGIISGEMQTAMLSGISGIVNKVVEDVKAGKIDANIEKIQGAIFSKLEDYAGYEGYLYGKISESPSMGLLNFGEQVFDVTNTLREYLSALEDIQGFPYETYGQKVAGEWLNKEKESLREISDIYKKLLSLYSSYSKATEEDKVNIAKDISLVMSQVPERLNAYLPLLQESVGKMKGIAEKGAFEFSASMQTLESDFIEGLAGIAQYAEGKIGDVNGNKIAQTLSSNLQEGIKKASDNLDMTPFQNAVIGGARQIAAKFGQDVNIFEKFIPNQKESLSNIRQEVKAQIESYETQIKEMQKSLTQGMYVLSEQVLNNTKESIQSMTGQLPALKAFADFLGGIKETKKSGGGDKRMQTLKNQIGLIKEMNSEYEKLIQNMAEEEAKLEVINSYRSSLQSLGLDKLGFDIDKMDFTDLGTIDSLEKLLGNPKYKANKYAIEIKKALDNLKVELKVEAKIKEREKLEKDIKKIFDRLELTKELKKLGIGKELGEELFKFDTIDTKGARDAIESLKPQFEALGEKGVKAYEDALDKINEMENKDAKERMKTYSKYLLEGMSERVKLKIEELRKLKEVEDSKEFTEPQKARIKKGVSEEAKKAQQSQEWKDFKETDMYTMMFEDLEHYGTEAIDMLYTKLSDLKKSLSDLPANEVKEIVSQIEKLENIKIERNPFQELARYRKEVKNIGFSEKELQGQLRGLQEREAHAQRIIDVIRLMEQATSDGISEQQALAQLTPEQLTAWNTALDLQKQLGGEMGDVVENQERIVKKSREGQEIVVNQISSFEGLSKSQQEAYKKTETWLNAVGDVFSASKELMTALGVESDSVAMTIADTGSSMVSLILSAVQFTAQLQVMGAAANLALGIIGWIAIALQAVATLLSAIFSAKDNKVKKQVEAHQRTVENLLESYEELEKKIDEAWSADAIGQYNAEMKNTMSLAIEAKKAAIAAQEQRKGADKEGSDNWQELQDMKAELAKMEQQLEDSLKESFSKITDGILDNVFDAAKEFTNAWYEAFKETGDGLSGLEENFNEMFMKLAKNQAAMQITGAFVDEWKRDLQKYLNNTDTRLTPEEAKAWAEDVKATMPELSAALEAFLGTIHNGLDMGSGELSALSKSIQGVSESTAQVLESLLSSMRFYVADSNAKLTQLLNNMRSGETESPMLAELRAQTKWMRDIYNLINGMTTTHPSGGRGIKTVM